MICRVSSSSSSLKKSTASATASAQTSVSERPGWPANRGCREVSVTARACSFSRAPAQATQPTTRMYFSNWRRCMPLLVLRYFDEQLGNDAVDTCRRTCARPPRAARCT